MEKWIVKCAVKEMQEGVSKGLPIPSEGVVVGTIKEKVCVMQPWSAFVQSPFPDSSYIRQCSLHRSRPFLRIVVSTSSHSSSHRRRSHIVISKIYHRCCS